MVFVGQQDSKSCKDRLFKVLFIVLLAIHIYSVILCIDLIFASINLAPDTRDVLAESFGVIVLNEFPVMTYKFYEMIIEKSEYKTYSNDEFMRLKVHKSQFRSSYYWTFISIFLVCLSKTSSYFYILEMQGGSPEDVTNGIPAWLLITATFGSFWNFLSPLSVFICHKLLNLNCCYK